MFLCKLISFLRLSLKFFFLIFIMLLKLKKKKNYDLLQCMVYQNFNAIIVQIDIFDDFCPSFINKTV